MTTKTSILAGIFAVAAALSIAGAASADTSWQAHHPRREEVNMRLNNQERRITAERREGEMSQPKARALRTDDRQIRREERVDAARDHSHITKTEQRSLNRQENQVSRQIGQ